MRRLIWTFLGAGYISACGPLSPGGGPEAESDSDADSSYDPFSSTDPIVEFRVSGPNIEDTGVQRAYAACSTNEAGEFQLLGLSGLDELLRVRIPEFDVHRVDPFEDLEVGYRPVPGPHGLYAYTSAPDSECQLTLVQVVENHVQGVFSCEKLTHPDGSTARLWEGDFACVL